MSAEDERPLRLGVSACLLGHEVRYDGGHKRDRFVTDMLGRFAEWVAVCPELESGMGVPRPTLRLVREGEAIRLREVHSGADHTRSLERFAARRVKELPELDGYVLKKDSPSCGYTRVKVFSEHGMARREGRGLFAEELVRRNPNLPVEDEGRLHDATLRENFIERLFAYRRLRELFGGRWGRGSVVAFHTAHKLQVMAHSTVAYRELGRLVAAVSSTPRRELRERYTQDFMAALGKPATRGRNANVLNHAAGHLKRALDGPARQELAALIDDYRRGLVPLVVPITLLAHHARRHQVDYLLGQTYLEPHPRELMLRNHV